MWMIEKGMYGTSLRLATPVLLAIAITMLCAIEGKAQDDDTTYAGYQVVYRSRDEPRGISLVDPVTLERTVLTDREDYWGDSSPLWSPDGTKILFRRGVNDLNFYPPQREAFIMNADGSVVTQITSIGTLDNQWSPSWAPNGQSIVLTVPYPRTIYRVDIGSGQATRLTPDSVIEHWEQGEGIRYRRGEEGAFNIVDYDPVYSPDGQRIAFTSRRDGNSEIYVMNADGSEQTRLTDHPAHDYQPQWINGGQDILFGSTRNGRQILRMKSDGSEVTQVTAGTDEIGGFVVSPDELRIAYLDYVQPEDPQSLSFDLHVMSINGDDVVELDRNILALSNRIDWSPDSEYVLITLIAEDGHFLTQYHAPSGEKRVLIQGSDGDWQPACSATD
jgi:Tol biopolymer transport system component